MFQRTDEKLKVPEEEQAEALAEMIESRTDPRRNGTCELCGGHGRELRILVQMDFIGWACETCREQLHQCQVRRYCSTGEETEIGE